MKFLAMRNEKPKRQRKYTAQINVWITPATLMRLCSLASKTNRSKQSIFREALDYYVRVARTEKILGVETVVSGIVNRP